MKQILGCMRKADEDFNLIEDGDKIAIGVSGGKDSLLLIKALKLYQRFSGKNFQVIGITVDLGFTPFDLSGVIAYAKEHDVEYIIEPTEIGDIIFNIRKEKNPCSLCAKMRKGVLYEVAKSHGCNKIALGHHRDDLIDTFYLSLLYEGKLNAISPKMYLSRMDVTAIRPLIYLPESEVLKAVKKFTIPVVKSPCPADGNTKREEIKHAISALHEFMPDVKDKTFAALTRPQNYNLWNK